MPKASDTYRAAILGDPYDPNLEPSRKLAVQAFEQLQNQVDTSDLKLNDLYERDLLQPNHKEPVDVATTENIVLSGEQTIDGFTTSSSRILVKNQTTPSENGVYLSSGNAWIVSNDFDVNQTNINWATVYVLNGDTQGGNSYLGNETATSFILIGKDDGVQSQIAQIVAKIEGVPSYNDDLSNGDRIQEISVSASNGLLYAGSPSNLVNGSNIGNYTNSTSFNILSDVVDHFIEFDFGEFSSKIITEIKWKQTTNAEHGLWIVKGSLDGVIFDDIGTSFTLGGNTEQLITTVENNVKGYRFIRISGVSGECSGSPYLTEVEFKITGSISDGATVKSKFPKNFPLSKLISAHCFGEQNGNLIEDLYSKNSIKLDIGIAPINFHKKSNSVLVENGCIETPEISGVKGMTILFKTDEQNTTAYNGFIVSGGSSPTAGVLQGGVTPTETNKIAGAGLNFHDLDHYGGYNHALTLGDWMILHREMTQQYSSKFGLGGRTNDALFRCASFEIAWAFWWNDDLTDEELNIVRDFIRSYNVKPPVPIHFDDTTEPVDLFIIMGESNAAGRGYISNLDQNDIDNDYRNCLIVADNNSAPSKKLDVFELGYNNIFGDNNFISTRVGPEIGIATKRRENFKSLGKKAVIIKCGVGSTYMAPSSLGTPTAQSWNVNENVSTGLYHKAKRQIYSSLQEMLRKNLSINKTIKIGMLIGLNDMLQETYTVSDATYQTYLQEWWDDLQNMFGEFDLELIIFRAHSSDPSSNSNAISHVRNGTDNFATANSNVTSVNTDAYSLNDGVHYDATYNKIIGELIHG